MTQKEIQEKYYPVPDGLTQKQREYHERMSADRACAFHYGYTVALDEAAKDRSDLEGKVSEYTIKNSSLGSRLELKERELVAITEKAIACLDSVKAMLEHTDGRTMTHRERDFYSQAMARYIDRVRGRLKADIEPTPF